MKESTKMGLLITGLSSAVLTGISYAVGTMQDIHSEQGLALVGMACVAGIFIGVRILCTGEQQ